MADDRDPSRYDRSGSCDVDIYSTVNHAIQWEDRVRTLKEIVQGGKFPCLVKVNKTDVGKYCPYDARDQINGLHDDVTLHVLELRRHKMVVAQKMQWDRRTGDYQETGKQTEINVTQKGWFEVLPENGQPVEYFDTINAIVGIKPKQFLVRTSIVGYQLSVENGNSCWMPWEIRPGEILTTGIVHMDHKKTKKKTLLKRIFSSNKNGGKREQELKYLQCFDSEEREIMVPLIMTGVFSPVGDPGNPNYDAVYNIHDLLSAFQLPVKAQLVQTDSRTTDKLPSGVLVFERLKDRETVLVAKHPYVERENEKFEIPLNDEFPVVREKRKKQVKQSKVELQETVNYDIPLESHYNNVPQSNQIDLPIRVKDPKKSKGNALLEKLSVRSKGKKERASLKALQEQGVFSSRLSKSEINFDDLCSPTNDESNVPSDVSDKTDATVHTYKNMPVKSKRELDLENDYSVSTKQFQMQDRDLPPIPVKTRNPRPERSPNKDSVYEELPLAPRPPVNVYNNGNNYEHQDMADDGYMTPAKFREMNDYNGRDFDVIKSKPPTAPRDSLRYTRARKVKSEYFHLPPTFDDDPGDSIDQMFDFTNNEEAGYSSNSSQYERRKQNPNYSHPKYQTKREAYQFQRQMSHDENRRFMDDSAIEARSASGFSKMKSRSHKNLNLETNATIRSHNVRKMKTAMEVFNFNDSLRDLRQPFQNGGDAPPQEPTYGRIVDNERIQSYVYNQQNPYGKVGPQHYVESEPAYRRYHRSSSQAALSDMFPSRGDDSAISCGEYGFQGESEYSYSEYSKWQDDKWIPPDDIEGLSVLEVSKSLRYIGMKDRVIIRFSNEQIDGDLLCTLDKKLLKEGFPELNALEIKKILDFVGGWRPKK